jgi:hypothetical protein
MYVCPPRLVRLGVVDCVGGDRKNEGGWSLSSLPAGDVVFVLVGGANPAGGNFRDERVMHEQQHNYEKKSKSIKEEVQVSFFVDSPKKCGSGRRLAG